MKQEEPIFKSIGLHFNFVKIMVSTICKEYKYFLNKYTDNRLKDTTWILLCALILLGSFYLLFYFLIFGGTLLGLPDWAVAPEASSNYLSFSFYSLVKIMAIDVMYIVLVMISIFLLVLWFDIFLYFFGFLILTVLYFLGFLKKYDLLIVLDSELKNLTEKHFKIFKKKQVILKINFSNEQKGFFIMKSDSQGNLVVFFKKSLMAQFSYEILQSNLKNKLEELIQIELRQLNVPQI